MIAGVVLAGGLSSRMGSDKSKLKLSGITLLEHSKNVLNQATITNCFISGKKGIKDKFKNKGPLVGIISSMEYLKDYQHLLFTSVDMPLMSHKIFNQLINLKNEQAVYIENHYIPLLIANSKKNRNIILKLIDNHQLSVKNMLKSINAYSIENQFDSQMFINANTKDDWIKIIEIQSNDKVKR